MGASVDSCPAQLPAQGNQPRQHQRIIRMGPIEVARECVPPERARAKQESRSQVPDGPRAFVAVRIVGNRAQKHGQGQHDGEHEQGGDIPGDWPGPRPNRRPNRAACLLPCEQPQRQRDGNHSRHQRRQYRETGPREHQRQKVQTRCDARAHTDAERKEPERCAATSAAAAETSSEPGRIRPAKSRPDRTAASLLLSAAECNAVAEELDNSQMIGLQQLHVHLLAVIVHNHEILMRRIGLMMAGASVYCVR